MDDRPRCAWSGGHPLLAAYHDEEWGVPVRDDRHLYEMLVLEGAQAGLSWLTVLKRREGYRNAFEGLDPKRVATYGPAELERLVADPGIVRHRGKVESAIANARALLTLREAEGTSFAAWLWRFVDDRPVVTRWRASGEMPAETELSRTISQQLRRNGFSFVGPTIVYAWLQGVGVVDDHQEACWRA